MTINETPLDLAAIREGGGGVDLADARDVLLAEVDRLTAALAVEQDERRLAEEWRGCHDATTAKLAAAWDEGHRAGWHNHRDGQRPPKRTNPYRTNSEGLTGTPVRQ